jgi:hypothetical protein
MIVPLLHILVTSFSIFLWKNLQNILLNIFTIFTWCTWNLPVCLYTYFHNEQQICVGVSFYLYSECDHHCTIKYMRGRYASLFDWKSKLSKMKALHFSYQ